MGSSGAFLTITQHKPTSRYLCACPDLDYFRFVDHSGNDTGSVRVLCQRCGEHALHNVSKVWVQGGATSQQVGESNTESTTGRCWPFQLRFPPPHCACRRHSPSFGKLSVLLLTPLGKGTTRKVTFCPAPRGHVSNGVQGPSIGTIRNHLTAGFLSAHKGRHFSRPHDQSR